MLRLLLNSSRNWKTNDFGVIYVCTTPEYLEMAIESVASLRENEPDVPILLYTGTNVGEEVTFAASKFDFSFQAPEAPSFSFLDKIEGMITSPFKKTLYLDSDTIVLGPIVENFSLLLEKSPLCALPNMHLNLELEEALVGDVFGQFNKGVIGYSRSLEANGADAVGLFFQEWKRIYLDLDGIAQTDQISFRLAVLSADLMCAPITERYNFMGGLA